MKILLTNFHLTGMTGSEIFTYTIAQELKQAGHEVYVYSAFMGNYKKEFEKLGIYTTDVLSDWKLIKFDIAHVHHNINAFEVRNLFPNLPIIFVSHGVIPFLEQPPSIDLHITKYLAVSEEVQNRLINIYQIPSHQITIFRNPVDQVRFFPANPINIVPQSILIISNMIDEDSQKVIREACEYLQLRYRFVGSKFEYIPNEKLAIAINQSDIVITLGRGVVESMFCGRIPIIYDRLGGDGMVTPDNFTDFMSCNFSGRFHKYKFTPEELVSEIRKYKPKYGEQLQNMALAEFAKSRQIDKLINIYQECISQKPSEFPESELKKISAFCQSIQETRDFSKAIEFKHIQQLQSQLEQQDLIIGGIYQSTSWKIASAIIHFLSPLAPLGSKRKRLLSQFIRFTTAPLKQIIQKYQQRREISLIKSSDLFNREWYLTKNPDVATSDIEPEIHYLLFGGFENRDPGPTFSSSEYLHDNIDARVSGINPLVHYLIAQKRNNL